MSKKRDIFWILDNYMTSDSASKEVKKYIENLIKIIKKDDISEKSKNAH